MDTLNHHTTQYGDETISCVTKSCNSSNLNVTYSYTYMYNIVLSDSLKIYRGGVVKLADVDGEGRSMVIVCCGIWLSDRMPIDE